VALALPGRSAGVRTLRWASLVYNLVVAGRPEEAIGLLPKARDADCRQRLGWFTLELARSALQDQTSDVNGALPEWPGHQALAA
jgi:hypothetical protein